MSRLFISWKSKDGHKSHVKLKKQNFYKLAHTEIDKNQ